MKHIVPRGFAYLAIAIALASFFVSSAPAKAQVNECLDANAKARKGCTSTGNTCLEECLTSANRPDCRRDCRSDHGRCITGANNDLFSCIPIGQPVGPEDDRHQVWTRCMNGCLFSYLHCLEQEEVVEHFLTEMCVVPRFECGIACDLALQEGGPVDF